MTPYQQADCSGDSAGIGFSLIVGQCFPIDQTFYQVSLDSNHTNATLSQYSDSACQKRVAYTEREFVPDYCYQAPNLVWNNWVEANNFVKISINVNPPYIPQYGHRQTTFPDKNCFGNPLFYWYATNYTKLYYDNKFAVFYCLHGQSYENICNPNGGGCNTYNEQLLSKKNLIENKNGSANLFYKKQLQLSSVGQLNDYDIQHNLDKIVDFVIEIKDVIGSAGLKLLSKMVCLKRLNIVFQTFFDVKVEPGIIPDSVIELMVDIYLPNFNNLDINHGECRPFSIGSIPNSVNTLTIDHKMVKHDIHSLIPSSVQNLNLYYFSCDKDEKNLIPITVKNLTIHSKDPNCYPFVPGCFPHTLQEFDFGGMFSFGSTSFRLEPGIFPLVNGSLKSLNFNSYKSPIEIGLIPDTVESIKFGFGFNHEIEPGIFPNSVKSIDFGKTFNNPLRKGCLPSSLIKLTIENRKYPHKILTGDILPDSLQSLIIGTQLDSNSHLPQSLEYLEGPFDHIPVGVLPKSLKTLVLTAQYTELDIGSIPDSVTRIVNQFNVKKPIIEGVLPLGLQEFKLQGFEQPTTRPIIPSSVTTLHLDGYTDDPLVKGTVPENVKTLFLGNFPLSAGSIPESVEYLTMSIRFGYPLGPGVLPSRLKYLQLSSTIMDKQKPESIQIPASLNHLEIVPASFGMPTISETLMQLIINLFNNCQSQLRIRLFRKFTLLSLDKTDPYIYFIDDLDASIVVEPIQLKPGSIPNQYLTSFSIFDDRFSECNEFRLEIGSIPDGIKKLNINHKYFQSDPLGLIPSSVTDLLVSTVNVGDLYREGGFILPPTVRSLTFDILIGSSPDDNDAQPIPLPQSLTELQFYSGRQDWGNTGLKLIPGFIPNSVRKLNLGGYHYQIRDGVIPSSVIDLDMGEEFNHPIEQNSIPFGVKTLSVGLIFQKQIFPDVLPSSITKLTFSNRNYEFFNQLFLPGVLPSTLTYLKLLGGVIPNDSSIKLPSSLRYLEAHILRIWKGLLPIGLRSLILLDLFPLEEIEIDSIPDTLMYLEIFSTSIRIPIVKGTFPSSLSTLIFRGLNKTESFPYLPDSITTLQLYDSIVPIPKGAIPPNVNKLIIQNVADFEDGAIPNSVQILVFKSSPIFPLRKSIIPSGLLKLETIVDQYFFKSSIFTPFDSLQELTINYQKIGDLISIPNEFIDFLDQLFSNSKSQLRVLLFEGFRLVSFDKNDPYIYFIDKNALMEESDIEILKYLKGIKSITYLSIRGNLVKIPKGYLSDNIECLEFYLYESNYLAPPNQILEEGSLPNSVVSLSIDHILFKHNLALIPHSVKVLLLNKWSYNPGEIDIIPRNVEKLYLLTKEDGSADPFGYGFPSSVTELNLEYILENSIPKHSFPDSIKYLSFRYLTLPLEVGSLPSKLETLKIFNTFPQMITQPEILPESLTQLCINSHTALNDIDLDIIPKSSLRSLDLNFQNIVSPPRNYGSFTLLKHLEINIHPGGTLPKGLLPTGLKELHLCSCTMLSLVNIQEIYIPKTVQYISLGIQTTTIIGKWVSKLFSESESRLEIEIKNQSGDDESWMLMSLDPSDPYIYLNNPSQVDEGFILKSNLSKLFSKNIFK
eukprot:gene3094-3870_t